MRSRALIPTSVVAVAAVSLLAAGCGGGSSTTAATTPQNGLVAYSHCIRSHGVPSFPDPAANEGIPKDKIPVANPRLAGASSACEHLMPAGGLGPQATAQQLRTRLVDELSFARCMRAHGTAHFPDPSADSELSVEMVQAHGIDVRSRGFLTAVQACLPASHGALTPAKVREALDDAGG